MSDSTDKDQLLSVHLVQLTDIDFIFMHVEFILYNCIKFCLIIKQEEHG